MRSFVQMKIFVKETDYANTSLISFYCNFREKSFLKGIPGRKSHCIVIRGKFWVEKVTVLWSEANLEPYQTLFMELFYEKAKTAKSLNLCLQ